MNGATRIKKVVVIGAGTMGRHIAGLLQRESVDVVLIDQDPEALKEVAERYDVQTLLGNGASPEILQSADVARTDLVLAFTDSCEVNILAASIAKSMGARRTIVRARAAWSIDTSLVDLRKRFDIDLMLNPELLTAIEFVKFLDNPDALAMNHYAHGKVQLRQFALSEGSPLAGRALKDCAIPAGVLVVMRSRGLEVEIPKGDHVPQAGDRLTLIGLPKRLDEAQALFHFPSPAIRNVVIAGGGNSGFFLAETLENRSFQVKLIDPDPERCEYLSERLTRTTVIRGDVTRVGFLKEERIGRSDVFIAVTGEDEDNIMACLLAKELGVKQTVARINRPDYASLVQKTGIDLAVSPRHVLADRVMTMILGGRIQSVSLLEEGRVQVIEFRAEKGAPIVGRPLGVRQEGGRMRSATPDGTLVSAIVRGGRAIVPRGEDVIRPQDTVIVVGLREKMDEVEELFRVS